MIQTIKDLVIHHQNYAPFIVFFSLILAGMNFPISIDIILVLSAFFAATTIHDHAVSLYICLLTGAYFSAWVSYWVGRLVGTKLLTIPFFASVFPEKKLIRMRQFYEKYGLWTLLVGRFIPFGVRNCLFMSTGLSRLHFGRFILRDALACTVWVSVMYFVFFHLSKNFETMLHYLKTFQIGLFLGFSVAVIGLIWYKLKKKKKRN